MTTQEKTTAIQKIAANQQDNRAAVEAAGVHLGSDLIDIVNTAINDAFKADLAPIFALPTPPASRRRG